MDKKTFVEQYVLTFMANYNSSRYITHGKFTIVTHSEVNKKAIESAELEWLSLRKLGQFSNGFETHILNLIRLTENLFDVFVKIHPIDGKQNKKENKLHICFKKCEKLYNELSKDAPIFDDEVVIKFKDDLDKFYEELNQYYPEDDVCYNDNFLKIIQESIVIIHNDLRYFPRKHF